jgi:hypothetical protein
LSGFDPLGAITGRIEAVKATFCPSICPPAAPPSSNTIRAGILSAVDSLKATVASALDGVRSMLPFSDAKEGPLSRLMPAAGPS